MTIALAGIASVIGKHGGLEKVQKLIADSLERTGLSPRYTRMLRKATWGCLRNYVLVSAEKREGFLILNIGGLEITLAVP